MQNILYESHTHREVFVLEETHCTQCEPALTNTFPLLAQDRAEPPFTL